MLSERLKKLRKEKGLTQVQLSEMIGISNNLYNKYEKQNVRPPYETISQLAKTFGVSVDYLLGRDSAPQIENAFIPDAIIPYPIIGEIKAGYDGAVEEYNTGEIITIPIEMLRGRPASDYFVLQVKGNSMYPKILEGDKVLILRTESVDSGSIAVVLYNSDEATIKKVEYTPGGNWIDLVPVNPEYETKRISDNDLQYCHILGKAVKLIRDI